MIRLTVSTVQADRQLLYVQWRELGKPHGSPPVVQHQRRKRRVSLRSSSPGKMRNVSEMLLEDTCRVLPQSAVIVHTNVSHAPLSVFLTLWIADYILADCRSSRHCTRTSYSLRPEIRSSWMLVRDAVGLLVLWRTKTRRQIMKLYGFMMTVCSSLCSV